MNILPTNRLSRSELTFESLISGKSFVVRADHLGLHEADAVAVVEYFKVHASQIKEHVTNNGALLFRGLPIRTPEHYEAVLEVLPYNLYHNNLGGASPRSKVTQKTFVSTEAPAPFIIGLHTEFCYQTRRPSMVSFFCVVPAAEYGETPLFDCAAILADLSPTLRERLMSEGLLYRRHLFGSKSSFNFRKTWQETFGTEERREAERFLDAEGMSYEWDTNGNLSTALRLPAVLTDPTTGQPCLSITLFTAESFIYNFRQFKDRYHPLLRMGLEWFVRHEYSKPDIFLKVLHGNGEPFTAEESREIQRAAWSHAIVFPWRTGDLLLLDNIRFGHARLNVRKPRRLIAAMGDRYDVRELPTFVKPAAQLEAI